MRGKAIGDAALRDILLAEGTTREIAAAYGVSRSAVNLIKRACTARARDMAQKLRDEGVEPIVWDSRAVKYEFTPEQIRYIRAVTKNATEVAAEAGCSPSLIRMIRTGKAYR